MLLLFFVAHVLETKLLYFFYDTAQVIYQAFVFNLVLVQVAAIVALYTIDDLVSELQDHFAQDRIVEDHQNEHAFEVAV